jgi:hypothetical protein
MKRTLLIAGLGIAVLLGGSMALVFLLTARPWFTASPPAPPIAVAPQGAGAVAPPTAPPPRAPPRRVSRVGWNAAANGLSWNAAANDPSATPMAGPVIRKFVRKALLAVPVQSRLARCVDRDGGFGGGAAPGRIPHAKPAVLMLELETLGGEVRIVEAQVQAWGGASAEVVSCAQYVLRGQVIAASTAGPGHRVRMPFPLNPRSETLAGTR